MPSLVSCTSAETCKVSRQNGGTTALAAVAGWWPCGTRRRTKSKERSGPTSGGSERDEPSSFAPRRGDRPPQVVELLAGEANPRGLCRRHGRFGDGGKRRSRNGTLVQVPSPARAPLHERQLRDLSRN